MMLLASTLLQDLTFQRWDLPVVWCRDRRTSLPKQSSIAGIWHNEKGTDAAAQVLEEAAEVDAKAARGESIQPLCGLGFAVKDNIDYTEYLTQAGSPALAGTLSCPPCSRCRECAWAVHSISIWRRGPANASPHDSQCLQIIVLVPTLRHSQAARSLLVAAGSSVGHNPWICLILTY